MEIAIYFIFYHRIYILILTLCFTERSSPKFHKLSWIKLFWSFYCCDVDKIGAFGASGASCGYEERPKLAKTWDRYII